MLVMFSNHIPHLVVGTLLLPDRESAKIHSNQANPIIRGPNQSLTSPTEMHNSLPLLNPNYSIANVHPFETFIDAFEHGLSREEYADPSYRYRVAFVPIVSNRASSADVAVEFVKVDSDEGREINRVLLKEVNKRRYTATEVWVLMQCEGYPKFNQQAHTALWKKLEAKNPVHGFGCAGDYKNTWVWYDKWIGRVRAHCEEQGERYR